MDRPLITVPPNMFRMTTADWDIDWREQSLAGRLDGISQTMFSQFPRFVASPSLTFFGGEIAEWRAVRAAGQGMLGIYRIHMTDPVGFDGSSVGVTERDMTLGLPTSDGNLLTNGLGFHFDPVALVGAGAAVGDGSITISTAPTDGVPPEPGQLISYGEDWPAVVTYVTQTNGFVYEIGVEPPLRSVIAVDEQIKYRAVGRFEVTESLSGRPTYEANKLSETSISLREVLYR